jgi:PAS domain S-box-containing protein
MGILGINGSTKAPVFTSPPQEGIDLGQILHPYIKIRCSNLLKQAKNGGSQVTEFIQLTGGYICRMQMLEVPSSENGQAFVCFFETHHRKSVLGSNSYLPKPIPGWSNGHNKTDNIYNKAFHSAPMPLAIFRLKDCLVLEVNDAFLKLGGYRRDEIIETNVMELGFWIDDQDPIRIGQLLKDNYFVHNLEVRFRIKNGRTIDTILNLDLVEVNGEQCVVAVAQDITGIKHTEARLKENEQLLVSINENLNEGIYRSTPKNGFIYVNKAFARMFGLTVEEAMKTSPEKLYANEYDRDRVTKALKTNGCLKNEQVEFLKRDGTTFWGFLSSILTKDADGLSIFDGAIVDISDLKRSKVLLHEKNDELQKINAELDRFVYSASHDLRAPLTSLLGLVNVAMLENNNSKLNGYLELMKGSVNKLDDLISDIIHFSRNARLDVTPEPVHFNNLAQETFDNLKYLPTAGSIDTKIQIEPYTNFYSDPKRLRILFNNLISNAFRYHDLSKETPYIKIQVSFDQYHAVIKVSDNGKGIHPEYLGNIFEMFYRATDDSQGSGLGLYIVKETVEKLQGTIRVESKPREGTTFTLRIPNLESN